MLFSTVALGTLLTALTATASPVPRAACPAYQLVSARGTFEPQTGTVQLTNTVNDILAAIPGGSTYEVVYPAFINYVSGPFEGANDLNAHVKAQHAACPNTKFVLLGYSEGAMVVITAENELQLPRSSVVGVVLYGNPYWKPGRSEDAGTATAGKGLAADVAGFIQTPASYVPITKDYCNAGDIVCTSAGGVSVHLSYDTSPQEKLAVAFVKGQLNAAGIY